MKEWIDRVLDSWPSTKGGNLNGVVTKDEFWQSSREAFMMI